MSKCRFYLVLWLLLGGVLLAQEDTAVVEPYNYSASPARLSEGVQNEYYEELPDIRAFDRDDYYDAIRGLNYADREEPRPKKIRSGWKTKYNAGWIQYVGIGLLALLVALVVFQAVRNIIRKKSKSQEEPADFGESPIDIRNEKEPDLILQEMIEEALIREEYNQVIRLSYLRVLAILHRNNYIKWKPYKTNRQYYREVQSRDFRNEFLLLTQIFEQVWYGSSHSGVEVYPEFQRIYTELESKILSRR